MKPPLGYDHPPNNVCRSRQALYGLNKLHELGLPSLVMQFIVSVFTSAHMIM